ncbi:hypothetical protein Ga0100231_014230 [Opitutaceae bacterium TAV4]|nr:hypothetical protein Ga0100231_014230 [Opitutaceae bacterium TAV4]
MPSAEGSPSGHRLRRCHLRAAALRPRPYPFSGEEKWWRGQLWRVSAWDRRHLAGRRRETSLGRHQKWRGRPARILFRCGRDARATLPSARCRHDAGAPKRYRAKSNLFRLSPPPPPPPPAARLEACVGRTAQILLFPFRITRPPS